MGDQRDGRRRTTTERAFPKIHYSKGYARQLGSAVTGPLFRPSINADVAFEALARALS
jgi:hypothetical protein